MKRIYITVALTVIAIVSVSCEKFFDRVPQNKFAANAFFASEDDFILYTNGLINSAMPGATSIALGEDLYTDLCGTKMSKKYYEENYQNPGNASGWSYGNWGFLRQVAYMLDNMHNAKDNVSEEKYNHYEGVARFWRGYATFNKVKLFGDCYFIDHVISPSDSTLLYGPRQDREYIVHKVVEDLQFACENCLTSGPNIHTDGRIYINRYVALAMASRILLYEGTFRKYHSVNPSTGKPWTGEYESAEDLLNLAFDYSKTLVELGAFSLNSNYRALFTSSVLPKDEVIWGRTFSDELGAKHDVTYRYCSTTMSQSYSPTKDYILMFLTKDGTPAKGDVSVTEEFNNRDNRLTACVLGPGQKMTDASGNSVDFAPNWTWTRSGYIWLKWVMPSYEDMNRSNSPSSNCMPIVRYAEVLLNYAEAAEELGKMSEAIWNQTVGALRTRGGVKNIYPGSGAYQSDSFLRDYYTTGLLHPRSISNTMLEIYRERVTELFLESDSRYDDLMRWNMGDLIQRRYAGKGWRGIYVTPAEAVSGFNFNGKHYTVSRTGSTNENTYRITSSVDQGFTLSEGTYGYLIYHYSVYWDDKMYTHPIPTTALNVNPNLGQNDGWQWM